MNGGPKVLVVDPDPDFGVAVVSGLRDLGRDARSATSVACAMRGAGPEVLVSATQLSDGTGLGLLQRFEQRGQACPTILTAPAANFVECQAALRAGVREFLIQPFTVAEVLVAVERLAPKPALPVRVGHRLSLTGDAEVDTNARAVRELIAFLVTQGFASATRARIAGAAAEVLENVARHAYPDGDGPFRLEAVLDGRRLQLEISDDGVGFDVRRVAAGAVNEPVRSGLARAQSLAETLRFDSGPDHGSRVSMEFSATSVMFADERGIDLSDLDYLDPALARRVLLSLRDSAIEPQFHLSPALAVCVGRLLSAPRPPATSPAQPWS